MDIKEIIQQINQELTKLKTKITNKLTAKNQVIANKDKAIAETRTKLQEEQRKVETITKENSENEATLSTLLQGIKELSAGLDK